MTRARPTTACPRSPGAITGARWNGPLFLASEKGSRQQAIAMKRQELPKPLRCAIYTRKSTEHGLELEFNSLHAQREACEAYIKVTGLEGWQRAARRRYDDGGLFRRQPGTPRPAGGCSRISRPAKSMSWSSTKSTA